MLTPAEIEIEIAREDIQIKDIKTDTINAGKIVSPAPEKETPIPETHDTKMGDNLPHMVLPPRTTFEQNVNTAGQRRINLIWEHTQAAIAITVAFIAMLGGFLVLIAEIFYSKANVQVPTILSVAFGTVVGFYFSRTNHQAIGGVGPKHDQETQYQGR